MVAVAVCAKGEWGPSSGSLNDSGLRGAVGTAPECCIGTLALRVKGKLCISVSYGFV